MNADKTWKSMCFVASLNSIEYHTNNVLCRLQYIIFIPGAIQCLAASEHAAKEINYENHSKIQIYLCYTYGFRLVICDTQFTYRTELSTYVIGNKFACPSWNYKHMYLYYGNKFFNGAWKK